jgi:hypothetical protein
MAFKKVKVNSNVDKGLYLSIQEDKNTKELSIKIFVDEVPKDLIQQTSVIYMSKEKTLEIYNEPINHTNINITIGEDK